MRWIDFIKVALGLSLRELSRAVEDGHYSHHSFTESQGAGADSMAQNTITTLAKRKGNVKSMQMNSSFVLLSLKCSPFLFPLA